MKSTRMDNSRPIKENGVRTGTYISIVDVVPDGDSLVKYSWTTGLDDRRRTESVFLSSMDIAVIAEAFGYTVLDTDGLPLSRHLRSTIEVRDTDDVKEEVTVLSIG